MSEHGETLAERIARLRQSGQTAEQVEGTAKLVGEKPSKRLLRALEAGERQRATIDGRGTAVFVQDDKGGREFAGFRNRKARRKVDRELRATRKGKP